MPVDPITLQVIQARLAGIVQEMQNSLFRTGYSTIIRESQDASCAILNTRRRSRRAACRAAAPHGRLPRLRRGDSKNFPLERNSPRRRLHHQPSLSRRQSRMRRTWACFTPIFYQGEWVGFAANMAHKSDIGGTVPGSGSGNAREIYQEGLHLPPVKFMSRAAAGKRNRSDDRRQQPHAGAGDRRSARSGRRRALGRTSHQPSSWSATAKPQSSSPLSCSRPTPKTACARRLPPGPTANPKAKASSITTASTLPSRFGIHVKVKKRGDRLHFDFSGSSDQTQGPANIRPPLVRAACAYCLVALVDRFLPINQGLARVDRGDLSRRQRRRSALSRGGQYLHADRAHRRGSRPASARAVCPRQAHRRRLGQRRAGARRARCAAATAPTCTTKFSAAAPARARAKTASRRPRFT